MKSNPHLLRALIAAAFLLAACEDLEHFTDPPEEGRQIVIPACKVDTLPDGEPLPPGFRDTTTCGRPL